jgi:lipid II:glycine glycyltransferase (peptidoglycan interpeptide bridge formation enzyme)
MNIDLQPKKVSALLPTDIPFQTAYWSEVKSRLGWQPAAFDYRSSTGQAGDVLLLTRTLDSGPGVAYVPQGPEAGPEPEQQGLFLEALSLALAKHLDSSVAFVRYDLPWTSPYASDAPKGEPWPGHPAVPLRELRMNFGTRTWNLRKAALDLTVADALVIDLRPPVEKIFAGMKSKTRYNIRLARKRGVSVFRAPFDKLPLFYDLYLQTAKRNGFATCAYSSFAALFSAGAPGRGSSETIFLLAARGSDILAGGIFVIAGRQALYLYGASAGERRDLMGPYALHWDAIRLARNKGCLTYDMGAVSSGPDSSHPFYGLYRFKTGFGGEIVHRSGSWDFPYHQESYASFRTLESINQLAAAAEPAS